MEADRRLLSTGIAVAIATMMMAVSLVVTVPSASAALTPAWVTEAPTGDIRCDAVIAQSGTGLVYVAGGYAVDRGVPPASDKINSYDPMTGAWASYAAMPNGVAHATGVVGADGRVYVISGYNYSTGVSYDTQILDPTSNTWSSGAPIPTAVLYANAAVGNDGMIYVFGGWMYPGAATDQVQIYDPELDSWSSGSPMPATRMVGVLIERQGYMYYIGGMASSGADSASTVYYYGYGLDSWYTGMPDLPEGVAHAQGVLGPEGVMYVIGGGPTMTEATTPRTGGYYYDYSVDDWAALPDMSVGGSYGGAALAADGRILVLAGTNNSLPLDRVESLQVMTEQITLSASTVAAGGEIMVTVSYDFAYLIPNGFYCTVYYQSGTGTVFEPRYVQSPVAGTFAFEAKAPALMALGDYSLVLDNLYVWAVGTDWTIGTREFAVSVVDTVTVDEQIAALQAGIDILQLQINALGAALAGANAALFENLTAINAQMDYLFSQLAVLQAALTQIGTGLQTMGAAQAAAMVDLNATLVDLQGQLDDFQEQIDRVENKADTAGTYGMVTMVLVILVVVLLVVMLMMARKKP